VELSCHTHFSHSAPPPTGAGLDAIFSEAPTGTGSVAPLGTGPVASAVEAVASGGCCPLGVVLSDGLRSSSGILVSVAPAVKGFADGNRSASWVLMRLMASNIVARVMGSVAPILAVATGRCVLSRSHGAALYLRQSNPIRDKLLRWSELLLR